MRSNGTRIRRKIQDNPSAASTKCDLSLLAQLIRRKGGNAEEDVGEVLDEEGCGVEDAVHD